MQAYYTIAGRELEREILPLVEDQGMGVMVWSPLAGGFLSGKFTREGAKSNDARRAVFDFPPVDKERAYDIVDAMRPIAEAHGVSVARVALAWLLSRKGVMSVIIGAKTIEQLNDNLAAGDLKLSAEELAELDQVSALKPEYPGWMLERQAQARVPEPTPPERSRGGTIERAVEMGRARRREDRDREGDSRHAARRAVPHRRHRLARRRARASRRGGATRHRARLRLL